MRTGEKEAAKKESATRQKQLAKNIQEERSREQERRQTKNKMTVETHCFDYWGTMQRPFSHSRQRGLHGRRDGNHFTKDQTAVFFKGKMTSVTEV